MKRQRPFPPIRIAGSDFKVEFAPGNRDLGTAYVGSISAGNRHIVVDSTQHPEEIRKTLFHEIIHAVDKLYGHESLKEREVRAIENGLWSVFRDNPGLAAAIFEG